MMPQPQGQPSQIPPQLLQLMMQARQGGQPPQGQLNPQAQNMAAFAQQAAPQMSPGIPSQGQGMQPPPQMGAGIPPQGQGPQQPPMSGPPPMQQGQPQGAPQMGQRPPIPSQGQPGGQQPMTAQQMAQQGRGGDSIMAHMTPGEVAIPPQVMTPQLMAALQQAFARAGVSPAQFTAGSPQSSVNPATGAPEFDFFSNILPMLAGGAAAFFAPELLPFLGAAAGPVAGGLGSFAGSLATGHKTDQALMAGLGGALGGYSGAGPGIGGAPGIGATADVPGVAGFTDALGNTIPGLDPIAGSAGAAATQGATSILGQAVSPALKQALFSGLGAGAGQYLGKSPNTPGSTAEPSYYNKPMNPINPNYQQIIGNTGASSTPQFAGYDPIASATQKPYNFFPQQPSPISPAPQPL